MSKWKYPLIQDLDNVAFVLVRQHFYDLLHELHMAENYKITHQDATYNVYWENVCEMIEYLSTRIDESIYARDYDSQSSGEKTK